MSKSHHHEILQRSNHNWVRVVIVLIVSIAAVLSTGCPPSDWQPLFFDINGQLATTAVVEPDGCALELRFHADYGMRRSIDTVRVFVEARYKKGNLDIRFDPSKLKLQLGQYEPPMVGSTDMFVAKQGASRERLSNRGPQQNACFIFVGTEDRNGRRPPAPYPSGAIPFQIINDGFVLCDGVSAICDTLKGCLRCVGYTPSS